MCDLEPRRDVPVVVEPCHDDLVSFTPLTRDGPGEREVERGHVGAEDHLVRRAAEEGSGGQPRVGDEPLGAPAGLVRAADVRVRLAQVGRDRVDHFVGDLRAAGAVEEGEVTLEGREAGPSGDDIEREHAHGATLAIGRIDPCFRPAGVQGSLWVLKRERT